MPIPRSATMMALAVATLIVVALIGSGCSGEDVPVVGDIGTTPLALRAFNESSTSAAAAFSGTVLLKGGCVALNHEGSIYTIVWLDVRTTWDPELQQVTMRRSGGLDDLVATVGEFEELGGQIIDEDWETLDWVEWAVKPGPDCPRKVAII